MSGKLVKKVELDGCPVLEMQAYDGKVLLKFKSGNIYSFDKKSYLDYVRRSFAKLVEADSKSLKKKLLDGANAVIARNDNDNVSVIKLRGVLIDSDMPDEEWFQPYEEEWRELAESMEAMTRDESNDVAHPGMTQLLLEWMSTPYDESGSKLNVSDDRRVQKAKTGVEDFPVMYFYTNFDSGNGYETWRKAIDPMIMSGSPVEDFI